MSGFRVYHAAAIIGGLLAGVASAASGTLSSVVDTSHTYQFFTNLALNDAGQLAFYASTPAGAANGYYRINAHGVIVPLLTENTQVPGLGVVQNLPASYSYDADLSRIFNNAGQLVVAHDTFAILLADGQSVDIVDQNRALPLGLNLWMASNLQEYPLSLNDRGEVIYPAVVNNKDLLLIGDRNGYKGVVGYEGMPAPGDNTGVTVTSFERTALINENGRIAYTAFLLPPPSDLDAASASTSIEFGGGRSGRQASRVYLAGDPVELTPTGPVLIGPSYTSVETLREGVATPKQIGSIMFGDDSDESLSIRLNNLDEVLVFGEIGIVGNSQSSGLFIVEPDGDLREVVRENLWLHENTYVRELSVDPFIQRIAFNDLGQALFSANLTDTYGHTLQSGLLIGDGRFLAEIIVAEGDIAPDGGLISYFSQGRLNNLGQVIFSAYIVDDLLAYTNEREAILLWDPDTGLTEIYNSNNDLDGQGPAIFLGSEGLDLNDLGQVAFSYTTAEHQGIAVWTPGVAVPEPVSAAVLSLGLLGLSCRGGRLRHGSCAPHIRVS
ncbi:MAG: hypothetical protein RIG82_00760 [Phycisphaeraceae bacterium]